MTRSIISKKELSQLGGKDNKFISTREETGKQGKTYSWTNANTITMSH